MMPEKLVSITAAITGSEAGAKPKPMPVAAIAELFIKTLLSL
jgi:hypothetical protein